MLFLVACETTPQNPEWWMERQINACLPTAIIFKESLQKYGIWSEVFRYSWNDDRTGKANGHAMVVYLYPKGQNRLWTYDAMGSYPTRAYTNDVQGIAQKAHWARGNNEKVYAATFIK